MFPGPACCRGVEVCTKSFHGCPQCRKSQNSGEYLKAWDEAIIENRLRDYAVWYVKRQNEKKSRSEEVFAAIRVQKSSDEVIEMLQEIVKIYKEG
jgi:hypothetical protein